MHRIDSRSVVVLFALSGALGQIQLPGTCEMKRGQAVAKPVIREILGNWHQVQRVPNKQESGDCATLIFTYEDGIGYITFRGLANNTFIERRGTIYKEDDVTGKFIATIDSEYYDFYVLSTDYYGYCILYSCKNNSDGTKNVWAWAITRDQEWIPSTEILDELRSVEARNPDLLSLIWERQLLFSCRKSASRKSASRKSASRRKI